jgi:hypothetical protein
MKLPTQTAVIRDTHGQNTPFRVGVSPSQPEWWRCGCPEGFICLGTCHITPNGFQCGGGCHGIGDRLVRSAALSTSL